MSLQVNGDLCLLLPYNGFGNGGMSLFSPMSNTL